jgi:prepilin-type N-terminal cleavage/methylation domain-containing protein
MQHRYLYNQNEEFLVKSLFQPVRKAFTMLEVVFVIVILGIVASIGAEIIASVYESYLVQRATHRSSIKTELAATQIANRLTYAVPRTVIGRISQTDPTYRAINDLDAETYKVMQWIGYDADSFGAFENAGNIRPGWSGLCDIDDSNVTSISTPGSNLDLSTTIINNLSNGTRTLADAALFFASTYNPTNISYTDVNSSEGLSNVASGTGETITLDAATARNISELYKLSWSSYAVIPVQRNGAVCTDPATQVCDLHLRYNFQPWNGGTYANATSQVLLRNVTVFRFTGSGNTVRFKICQRENIGEDFNITTCKEKAVIR